MDARIRYTQNMLRISLIELLKETNIGKITVSAICKGADINRATFYKYYDNPYDLLMKLEDELLAELQVEIEEFSDKKFDNIMQIVLTDIKNNADIYSVIFSPNGDLSFKERLFDLCYQENMGYINLCFPNLSAMQKEWLYNYVLEGTNGVINQWINEGMVTPIDEVVSFTRSIAKALHKHLIPYIEH